MVEFLTVSTIQETDESAEARAERGAIWFDQVYPEWFTHIDTDALRLDDSCNCVWGQAASVDYNTGVKVYLPTWGGMPLTVRNGYELASKVFCSQAGEKWFVNHGFLPDYRRDENADDDDEWDSYLLDAAWIELIEKRKADAGLLA